MFKKSDYRRLHLRDRLLRKFPSTGVNSECKEMQPSHKLGVAGKGNNYMSRKGKII